MIIPSVVETYYIIICCLFFYHILSLLSIALYIYMIILINIFKICYYRERYHCAKKCTVIYMSYIIIDFIWIHCMLSHTKKYMKQVKKCDYCDSKAHDTVIIYMLNKTNNIWCFLRWLDVIEILKLHKKSNDVFCFFFVLFLFRTFASINLCTYLLWSQLHS